jgi:hypothetical protein
LIVGSSRARDLRSPEAGTKYGGVRSPAPFKTGVRLPYTGYENAAHALLSDEPDADEARIRSVLSGNLCRCTG